ncbi:MAG: tetratricopeptide repeat protein [Bacteroidetes bacterium]|nr:tetratricopeptide repeat protein [Bacteroidota bacterium]
MKKRVDIRVLLLTGLLALPVALCAQTGRADSLRQVLQNIKQDTQRVNVLTELAWEINERHTDESAALFEQAAMLAKSLGYAKGEAAAWNGLGVVEEIRGNLAQAEANYKKALAIRRQLNDLKDLGASLNNLGVINEMTGHFDTALVFHRENLRIQEQLRDTVKIARAQFNLAAAYQEMGLYPEAQSHLLDARLILEARNDRDGMAKVYTQLGHLQLELDRYSDALKWYTRALHMRERLDDPARLAEALTDYANALDEVDSSRVALTYYQRALQLWKDLDDLPGQANVYTNIGDAYKHIGNYDRALRYLQQAEKICLSLDDKQALMEVYNTIGDVHYRAGRQSTALEYVQKYYNIALETGDEKYVQGAYKDFAEVYARMGNFAQAYHWRVQYDSLRYVRLNEKIGTDFVRKEAVFADQKKQEEIEEQKREIRVRDAELASAQTRQWALLGGAVLLLLVAGLLYNRNRIRARANSELAAKNRAIQLERERADNLLTNILPEQTALELKLHNKVQPVRYESVTVMFTDFKGFTTIAESMSPEALIAVLDECFRLFDEIISRHGLEKIKTIGDSYMCAGGLPVENTTHAFDTVSAAMEMLEELRMLMQRKSVSLKTLFEMRIGIHTGPVVAGVVGSHKFAYDIWGDTVNVAARLEQGGEIGRINVSETTYQHIKDHFHCTYRGHLAAKNKGEIAMYFVDGPKLEK